MFIFDFILSVKFNRKLIDLLKKFTNMLSVLLRKISVDDNLNDFVISCYYFLVLIPVHMFGSVNFCLEHNKFSDLLNSIRSKCQQCKSWTESKKAIRASLVSIAAFF